MSEADDPHGVRRDDGASDARRAARGVAHSAPAGCEPDMPGWRRHTLDGFAGLVGPLYTRRADDGRAYAMRAEARHLNPAGSVHGGMLATLLDQALSAIAWQAAGRAPCVSVQLYTQFYAPVRAGAWMVVQGRVQHRAGSLMFLSGELTVDGHACASAAAVMKVLAPHASAEADSAGNPPAPRPKRPVS